LFPIQRANAANLAKSGKSYSSDTIEESIEESRNFTGAFRHSLVAQTFLSVLA